jgi:hypothetical protein
MENNYHIYIVTKFQDAIIIDVVNLQHYLWLFHKIKRNWQMLMLFLTTFITFITPFQGTTNAMHVYLKWCYKWFQDRVVKHSCFYNQIKLFNNYNKVKYRRQEHNEKDYEKYNMYRFHGFISNSCKIYYFIGLYCLNTNVMHYFNTEVVCMTFVCKQHE